MILDRIYILNYKNLKEVDATFSPKLNCFVGLNGMGKTNLLDAIYFLSFCKSSTNSIDSQNIMHDAEFFIIQGFYHADDGTPEEVYCGLKRRQKKQFKRNRKEYQRLSDHIGLIPLVMVSPDDAVLLLGGSSERRRFMDVVISQYDKDYLTQLIKYNKALMQRNAMLRDEDHQADEAMYDVLEEVMAATGEVIYGKRKKFIEEFIPIFQDFYSYISDDRESVGIEYESHCSRGPLLGILRASREKDRIVGFSLHGIHKDDLVMSIGDFAMRREGSQGQNKTFLVALKLAQLEFLKKMGSTPILLLDDIFDKLDAQRVEKIVKLVSGDRFGQIFITDTDRGNMDRILQKANVDYRLFGVSNGEVSPIKPEGDTYEEP